MKHAIDIFLLHYTQKHIYENSIFFAKKKIIVANYLNIIIYYVRNEIRIQMLFFWYIIMPSFVIVLKTKYDAIVAYY